MRNRLPSTENSSACFPTCTVAGHQNQDIILLCCNKDCMTPLCQECIQIHSEYHQEINRVAILKSFRDVKDTTSSKLKNAAAKIDSKLLGLQALLLKNEIEQVSDLEILSKCRSRLVSIVNKIFDEFEAKYKNFVEQERSINEKIVSQATNILQPLSTQIKSYQNELNSEQCLNTVKKIYHTNYDSELEQILTQTNVLELESKGSRIGIESHLADSVSQCIRDSIRIGYGVSQISQTMTSGNSERKSAEMKASVYYTPNTMSKQGSGFIEELNPQKDNEETKLGVNNSELMRTCMQSCTVETRHSKGDIEVSVGSVKSEGVENADIRKILGTRDTMEKESQQEANEGEEEMKEEEKQAQGQRCIQVQEEEEKQDDADEVMTQQTVYSSETDLKEGEFEDAVSNVESDMSEKIVFEEITESK